jgi:hypothetical protein
MCRRARFVCLGILLLSPGPTVGAAQTSATPGVELANLSWIEAQEVLTPQSIEHRTGRDREAGPFQWIRSLANGCGRSHSGITRLS